MREQTSVGTRRSGRVVLTVAMLAATLVAGLVSATGPAVAAEPAPGAGPCAATGPNYTYIVTHREFTPRLLVDSELRRNCATTVEYYPEIGVSVARSAAADFPQRIGVLRAYSGAREVAERDGGAAPSVTTAMESERTQAVAPEGPVDNKQWDMAAIKAPQAHAIDRGRRSVVVGVLDSGIDPNHPAFRASLARDRSVGCLTGAPQRGEQNWAPTTSDHGTHVAGTIAGDDPAARFTGVAPGVSVASVKVVDDNGYIFPEAAVCGLMWAARQHFPVTNNSYFIDPGTYFCDDRPGQAAVVEAVRRAVRYSAVVGTTTVTAAGNDGFDATAQTVDNRRGGPIDDRCGIQPAAAPGVVTVSSVGFEGRKAAYSNWGAGYVDVTAPGGSGAQPVPGQPSGCVLSSIPGGQYGYMCGTSMASPHAAGVLALLAGRLPAQVGQTFLDRQADPVPCTEAACSGPPADNSFYGHGRVDALDAVTGPGLPGFPGAADTMSP